MSIKGARQRKRNLRDRAYELAAINTFERQNRIKKIPTLRRPEDLETVPPNSLADALDLVDWVGARSNFRNQAQRKAREKTPDA